MWRLAVHPIGFPERLRKVIEVVIAQAFVVDWQISLWSQEPGRRADVLVVLVGDRWPIGMPVPIPDLAPKLTAVLQVADDDQLRGHPLSIARHALFSQLTQTLVMVAELSRQHQGRIPSTPIASADSDRSAISNPKQPGTRLALVVDQHAQAQQLISAELAPMGFQVLTASNADQALELARSRTVTLAVIDTDLPGAIDGITLGSLLRERAAPPVSVLMLTNHGGNRERLRALVSGTQAFLVKPVDRLLFRTEIHRLLALARTGPVAEAVH
ncbi:hypothetical protein C7S18_10820 [Ahniella affigens]|uniref:Response regulatory domain-containing protein n=1 Tax=Ahniella affigens TaxID=2021234 RepID=A0A2P1PS60_9GAMM|nr:response regulator [Ahniella affigens]AVP97662.1 hypothetical protein C7S18_10820 [Ahniella affigens]